MHAPRHRVATQNGMSVCYSAGTAWEAQRPLCSPSCCMPGMLQLLNLSRGCGGRAAGAGTSFRIQAECCLAESSCGLCRQSPAAKQLHAVAVFGAPQPGDAEFARLLQSRLPGGCVRCQHAADMVGCLAQLETAVLGRTALHCIMLRAAGSICCHCKNMAQLLLMYVQLRGAMMQGYRCAGVQSACG